MSEPTPFIYRTYDIKATTDIATAHLYWPSEEEACDETGLGCNHDYMDLRDLDWSDAARVFALESELILRIERSCDPESESDRILEELADTPDDLHSLDIGVASCVVALSAAGCVPFTSCNAGAFGGIHGAPYPLVGFFAQKNAIDPIRSSCQRASIGLAVGDIGNLAAYASDIRRMRRFADVLIHELG